jgi:hypothetical protein
MRAAIVLTALAWGGGQAWEAPRVMQAAQRQGGNTPQRAQALVQLIGEAAGQDEESRLKAINGFFNRSVL